MTLQVTRKELSNGLQAVLISFEDTTGGREGIQYPTTDCRESHEN